jgi:hypothetical protein
MALEIALSRRGAASTKRLPRPTKDGSEPEHSSIHPFPLFCCTCYPSSRHQHMFTAAAAHARASASVNPRFVVVAANQTWRGHGPNNEIDSNRACECTLQCSVAWRRGFSRFQQRTFSLAGLPGVRP